jgi:hypothetical protein
VSKLKENQSLIHGKEEDLSDVGDEDHLNFRRNPMETKEQLS